MKIINDYLKKLQNKLDTGLSTEHTFREDFSNLLQSLIKDSSITIINEPRKLKDVGIPDFSVLKNSIPIGYIETKDINKNLDSKEFKTQFERYIKALNNLLITNYLHFQLYKNSEKVADIKIADFDGKTIKPIKSNFKLFENIINEFLKGSYVGISSPSDLAKIMADKALLLKDIIYATLKEDKESTLQEEFRAFKTYILHDIKEKEFADLYAQTIVYGLFLARYNDPTKEDFSREEARKLIPSSHPFLKGLFSYISDNEKIESSIRWIIDDIVEIFRRLDLKSLFIGHSQDPIIYFYEDFLKEYDPKTRKSRGVWYTPKPVVEFIVKSIDEILKEDFNLTGLDDTSKVEVKNKKEKKIFHKVQILDPACGTGTFLASIVEHIKDKFLKENYPQYWGEYAEKELIPRLNGFELLMASYAMAHLKMDMVLQEGNYKPKSRINIYLTNSLEPPNEIDLPLFFAYMAQEVKTADRIKKEYPIMVVLGNPPYSFSSQNKNDWIENLLKDYKEGLNERKTHLNDDYIRFIRLSQWYIDKNKEGIVAYITNNSFIDGLTHRRMREQLLKSFDKIYILNLHGDTRKKEKAPDGSKDENVFDIQQGVSINIFVKKSNSKKLAEVYYADLWGLREDKYKFLNENSINTVNWQKLEPKEPMFYFVSKDFSLKSEYEKGFGLDEIFTEKTSGIITSKDELFIDFSEENLKNKIKEYLQNKGLEFNADLIKPIHYRPFDVRYIYYDTKLIWRARENIMQHFIDKENVGLILNRESRKQEAVANSYFITKNIIEGHIVDNIAYLFPLYLYQNNQKTLNLNPEIIKKIENSLGLKFNKDFNEYHILDYIYAVLHSPTYREKYKEFLKIDFPKVPYPQNKETFFKLAELGEKLRKIHLLEDETLNKKTVEIIGSGEIKIQTKLTQKDIKEENHYIFAKINQNITLKIPKTAWELHIGGYQPAQKYLKDRYGRTLSLEEFTHYNKIINAFVKTIEIMEEIDLSLS